MLLPPPAGVPAYPFLRRRACNTALTRTERCRRRIHESLHRDWLKENNPTLKELLTPGEFKIVPVLEPKAEAKS